MRRHLTNEELSAYLDGEHRRPAVAKRHLQECETCARAHVAMQKLSAHVRSLPEPEITFGFRTRVMRAIESGSPVARSRRIPRLIPAGVGIAALIALALSAGIPRTMDSEPARVAETPQTAIEPVELAGVLGPNGSERGALGDYSSRSAELQVAFASATFDRTMSSEVFRGADYNASLFALDASEKETLLQLLGSTVLDEHMM